jgi:hypothetical protein
LSGSNEIRYIKRAVGAYAFCLVLKEIKPLVFEIYNIPLLKDKLVRNAYEKSGFKMDSF